MARRRSFDIFSMSFLDTICCAFGAVILLYMILNASAAKSFRNDTPVLRAEVDRLEEQVLEGYQGLVAARNSLRAARQADRSAGEAARLEEEAERLRQQLAESEQATLSKRESIELLKQDLRSLEEGNRRLAGGATERGQPGTRIKGFVGSGDRQYLTGLKVGGDRILILVDVSASMMDETVVNVIRMRNMPEARRMTAPKWRRAVSTADWLISQLPAKSRFQVYGFNTSTRAMVAGSDGRWLDAGDAAALGGAVQALRRTVPQDGTSLENAFAAAMALAPRPDNIVLVTDGLPTQGASPPALRNTIDGEGRLKLFERAIARLPTDIPVNVILLPMEGDPLAPGAYWALARRTKGSFLSPARDWP